ncbi:MAG: PAS domain-containing sensor histidine kinase, partial [Flammeovirgaceae bacterium]|nr:PAS domain-containing sensor histidine kinase [Flammeovirgaceae bacterium]MDW8286568.1 PAS domain S-box protein [Flammeovirgaceae bacterium]
FSVFLKSILQEDVAAFHEKLMTSARQHTPLHAEFRMINETRKRIVWLETHASTYLLGDGNVVLYGYLNNITEKKNLEKRLSLLSMVAKRTSNAVIITDAKRRITWVNEGFTRITGYTFADVVGKKPSEVVQTTETSPQTIALMREKLNNHEEVRCEILNRRKDGTTYWVFIEIQPLFNEKGELTGYAAIETDITERKKMTDDLEHLLKITQNQNQRLREYAYITSHNIRSPLSSMMGLCELLKEEPTNATYLEMLDTSVKRLDFVVRKMNELLNIENNSQNLPRELINLKKAVEENCQMLKNLMDETGIELILNIPEELSVTVIPAYLDSILNNLISNAIKYRTRTSKPFIEISANKSENFVVLSVKDNGLGIDLEKYGNKLFKMNSRFHLQIDGKGIGLFLTKHQIEAMGGKITVESKPNSGSIFNVWFYEAS